MSLKQSAKLNYRKSISFLTGFSKILSESNSIFLKKKLPLTQTASHDSQFE